MFSRSAETYRLLGGSTRPPLPGNVVLRGALPTEPTTSRRGSVTVALDLMLFGSGSNPTSSDGLRAGDGRSRRESVRGGWAERSEPMLWRVDRVRWTFVESRDPPRSAVSAFRHTSESSSVTGAASRYLPCTATAPRRPRCTPRCYRSRTTVSAVDAFSARKLGCTPRGICRGVAPSRGCS